MIRILNAYFPVRTLLLGVSEACLITLAFLVAAIARLGANGASVMLNDEQGIAKIVAVLAAFVICMYHFDLYDPSFFSNRGAVFSRLMQVMGTTCILLAVVYYLYPPLELGRGVLLIGFLLVASILLLWRRLFSAINGQAQLAERVLILGDSPLGAQLLHEFESRPELGVRVVGLDHWDDESRGQLSGILSTKAFDNCLKSQRVNRIVVAMGERRGRLPVEPLLALKSRGVRIQDGNEVYESLSGKIPIESIRSGWLLFSPGCHASRLFLIYKRVASVFVSTIGLLFSLPLLPLIVLAIRLTSRGPALYRQSRVGRNGIVFDCYKFRTMRADAEADTGPTWAGDDDPRITPVGRFLRKSRMDEIPQLWNVLRGDMSLVGPRPERPEFVDRLNREIRYYSLRHAVRPGITGWAQIRYKYGSSVEDAKEKLRYDLYYIKNLSAGLDLLIVFDTIKVILWGRGAK